MINGSSRRDLQSWILNTSVAPSPQGQRTRRETVRSLSGVGVRALRGPFPSTRGPGRTHLWCTSYRAHGKRWVAKCGADNCWKHLSRKPTSRWVLSYSYFPGIMAADTAEITTDFLSLQRMERQKYWESKIRSRQDEPFIITIGAKWKCSNVCSWGILTDREIWTLFLYDLIVFIRQPPIFIV